MRCVLNALDELLPTYIYYTDVHAHICTLINKLKPNVNPPGEQNPGGLAGVAESFGWTRLHVKGISFR